MRKLMAGVGATVVALASHAETTSPERADSVQLEEVTVTAERRLESVADVPVSVTVFNAATIEKLHFQDAQDFIAQTPNVSFQQTGLNGARQIVISMRGISDIKSGEKIDTLSAFSTYVDEFGLGTLASGQANPSAYDTEAIEVLLGPQGTFFGRNSEGGAINITTRRPDKNFFGQIDVGGGNFGTYELDGIINIPVTDTLFVRETIETTKTDGFVRNRNPVGGSSTARFLNSRTQLRWKPTEATTVDLSLTRTIDDQDYPNMVPTCIAPTFGNNPIKNPAILGGIGCYDPNDAIENLLSNASNPIVARVLPAGLASGFNKNPGDSIYENSKAFTNNSDTLAIGKIQHDFSHFSVTSITGQIQSYQSAYQDLDQSGVDAIDRQNGFSAKDWSEEVRIASLGQQAVDWTLGGLYYNDQFNAANRIIIKDFVGPWIRGDYANENNVFAGRSGYGIFGNLTWNVTQQWALIVGGRFGHDESEQRWSNVYAACGSHPLGQPLDPGCQLRPDQVAITPVQVGPDGTVYTSGGRMAQTLGTYARNSDTSFTPRVALRWKPNEQWSGYVTVSEGYKPAGAEANPDSGFEHLSIFGKEKMRNYEVGFNGRMMDNRISVNGAVFRMDWTNMQVEVDQSYCNVNGVLIPEQNFQSTSGCVLVPLNGVQNARKARSQGMELASQALVGNHWHFGVSGGFLDAKFLEYVQNNAGVLVDFAGRRLPSAPRWTASGFGEFSAPIGASADAFIRADVIYRDTVALGTAQADVQPWPSEVPSYTIANLTAGVNYNNQSVTLQVKNLFDRQYFTGTEGFSYGGTLLDVNPRTLFVKWTWKTR